MSLYGGEGVWKIKAGYIDTLGHVYADDRAQAEALAKMFFEYLLSPDLVPKRHYATPDKCSVEFISFGTPLDLPSFNNPLIEECKKNRDRKAESLEDLEKEVRHYEAKLETMQLVQVQQLETILSADYTPPEEE